MKFNKRILGLLLILVLSLSFVACSTDDVVANPTSMEILAEAPEVAVEAESSVLEDAVVKYFAEKPSHSYLIAQTDFIEKVKANEDIFILDIRSAADYEAGHVKGAVNAPWGTAISDNLKNIPADKEVFVYCYSGQTAGQTVTTLNIAGFDARSVKYGWKFGISKVEGIADVTETTVNNFGEAVTDIQPEIQTALDAYFAGLADVKDTKFTNYKVSEDNLKAMIETEEDFYLVSFRKEEDYNNGHIAGANLLTYGTNMQEKFASLPTDKTIVGYCYSGQTAGQSVAALRILGYDAISLNGGMGTSGNNPIGWSNKGYDVVSETALEDAVIKYFAEKPSHSYLIAQDELVAKVKANEDIFILDIRSAADYEAGHVKGAVNAPWGVAISENLKNIPADKEVFVYCYSGQTAGQTVAILNVAGFNARSVKYGWKFGISKVEGIADVTETTVNNFEEAVTEINPEIQLAANAYYKGLASVKDTKFANYKVSEDNLKAMIENKEDFYLVSFRKEEDYNNGHIAGANLLSYGTNMQEKFASLPTDKTIVGYCYSGQTAGQTVAILRLLGYDAISVNGGMGTSGNNPIGWSNKGYELVK